MSSAARLSSFAMLILGLLFAGMACSPKVDCRQASAACADGFTCTESTGGWTCTPVGAEPPAPNTSPAATVVNPRAARELSKVERRAHAREATMNIRKMFDSSVSYYSAEFAARDGRILPRQFPGTARLTPDGKPTCRDGRPVPFQPAANTWRDPTWQSLNFSIDGPHYYRYEYISTGTGNRARFTARAIGDLDCDGVLSTFERVGVVDNENNVNGGAGLFMADELE